MKTTAPFVYRCCCERWREWLCCNSYKLHEYVKGISSFTQLVNPALSRTNINLNHNLNNSIYLLKYMTAAIKPIAGKHCR